MRRSPSPAIIIRSVIGALMTSILLGALGLAPAGAVPVREPATLGPPRVASLPASSEFTAPSTSPFADVGTGHDFYEEISWLSEAGVSTGWSGPDGTRLFRPYQPVLRDQMAAFLYRMAGSPTADAPATSPFADVPTSHGFYEEISWLAQAGISNGWTRPDGTKMFGPHQPVLRDQMAAFLYRMAGSPPFEAPATSPFADVPTSHDFYHQISWLAATGVSTGWSGPEGAKLFRPHRPVLRDQMAAFLHRIDPLLPGRDVPTTGVVSSYDSAYALRDGGTVWAWGQNHRGQLGNGTTTDTSVPVQVPGLSDIGSIETNGSGVFAVRSDGTVWAWGGNRFGQLGIGTITDSPVPVQVTGLPQVRSITAEGVSTYALTTEGTVWAWGLDTAGRPGEGTTPHSTVPVEVSGLSDVESLAAHQSSVYALASDGTVWTWGSDPTGQPDDDTTTEASAPVRVAGLTGVRSLQVQYGSAYALKSDGTVWAWGSNHVGQLGNGTTTDSPVPVQVTGLAGVRSIETSNASSAYAVTTDGAVWAWGNNRYGELGNATTTDSTLPVRVTGLPDVESIDSINHSAYALTTAGTVWAWGWNQVGQLGNGTRTDSSVPVPVSRLNG